MKKIAIVTLLAAASLASHAQVTLTGKIGQWVDYTKVGSASATTLVTEPTSNFALNAVERMGGLTTRATIETSLRGNTINGSDTRLGDRQFTAGLSSALGSVDVGRNVHSQFLAVSNADAFGTLYGSIAGDVHALRGLRIDSGVFVSLTPIKGVSATFDSSLVGGNDTRAWSVNTKVAGVAATVARFEQSKDVSTVLTLATSVAGYGVSYTHSDDRSAVGKTTGDSVGVTKAVGAYTAKASVGRTDFGLKAYALGVDYALSKRTSLGATYRNVDRAGAASDTQSFGAGLVHRF